MNGYVIFPEDWTVLEVNSPADCPYVGHLFTNRVSDYPPYNFIFFSHVPIFWQYMSQQKKDEILDACIKACPDFQEIVELQPEIEKLDLLEKTTKPFIHAQELPILGDGYNPHAIVIWD